MGILTINDRTELLRVCDVGVLLNLWTPGWDDVRISIINAVGKLTVDKWDHSNIVDMITMGAKESLDGVWGVGCRMYKMPWLLNTETGYYPEHTLFVPTIKYCEHTITLPFTYIGPVPDTNLIRPQKNTIYQFLERHYPDGLHPSQLKAVCQWYNKTESELMNEFIKLRQS